ncbi:hypothetical protein SAMN05518871_10246 [Psychrobacillus sp. OK028]|uniref:hypothetical protein n=1 Tax=Psychrobacillus sp. OK028 TaxID=1884359 RepID=UPI000883FC8A|nr:hypothetical protein [Psychrobacillus sp. OK028]SDM70563.1 hypothetical protein SAMN05518871_10246 [Psychrobacillus sp. OK028]
MLENELFDEKDNRKYFVYMTNRSPNFPMFEGQLKDIENRMYEEIDMGYTNLWVMERIGILKEEKWTYFPENDLKDTENLGYNREERHNYCTFIFQKMNADSPFILYSSFEKVYSYSTFEEAVEDATQLLNKKNSYYPERVFYVLCGKLLKNYTWH